MVDRTHHDLTDDDIARIAWTYHAWRDGQLRPTGFLQERPARRGASARPRPDAGPLCRRGATDGRWRTVRGQDASAGRGAASTAGRGPAVGRRHRGEHESVGPRREGVVSNSDERRWQQQLDNFGTALTQLTNACGLKRLLAAVGRARRAASCLLQDTGCWATSLDCHIRWLSIKPDDFPSGPSQLIEVYVS